MKKLLIAILAFTLLFAGCAQATMPVITPTENSAPVSIETPVPTPTPVATPFPTPIPTPIPLPTLSPEYVNAYAKALATEDDVKVPEEYLPDEEISGPRMVDGHIMFYTNNGCNIFMDGEKTDTILYECVWVDGLEELPKDFESLEKAFDGRQKLGSAESLFVVHFIAEIDKPDGRWVDNVQLYRHGDEIVVVYRYFERVGEDVAFSELYINDQLAEEFYT